MRPLLVIILLVVSHAASFGAGNRPIIGDRTADLVQTIHARKMLADDPDLQGLNIGVIVENRVATLWGPVPSAEVAFRAEVTLRTMIELVEVKNDTFITELREPIRRPLKIDVPPVLRPDQFPPKLPTEPRIQLGIPGVIGDQPLPELRRPKSK